MMDDRDRDVNPISACDVRSDEDLDRVPTPTPRLSRFFSGLGMSTMPNDEDLNA
jgi:hypothetical protein